MRQLASTRMTAPSRLRSSVRTTVTALLGCALVACTSTTAGVGTTASIAGRWNVTYGAPTVVTIAAAGRSSYTMTGAHAVAVIGDHCRLRAGTLLAGFTGTGGTYSGRHGLWDESTCAFVRWTTLRLTLEGDTASARLGDGEVITYTRRGEVPVPAAGGSSWPWLLVSGAVVLVALLAWAYARRRSRRTAS
jgi:LPXTG-motif cell wall-anchored protein